MSLTKEGLRSLSANQLWAIKDLPSFKNEREKILQGLLNKSGLGPIPFREVHSLPQCQLGYRYLGSRRSGFVGAAFLIDQPLHQLQIECKEHGVQSGRYDDFSFPKDLEKFK